MARVFASHSALTSGATTPSASPNVIVQSGYSASGDGGWAEYDWNATSTATADGVAVILPSGQSSATAGRYVCASPPGSGISPLLFGAKGNGTTDDTAAVQAAISASRRSAFPSISMASIRTILLARSISRISPISKASPPSGTTPPRMRAVSNNRAGGGCSPIQILHSSTLRARRSSSGTCASRWPPLRVARGGHSHSARGRRSAARYHRGEHDLPAILRDRVRRGPRAEQFVRISFARHNVIRDPTGIGLTVGRNTYGGFTVGIDLVDNRVACDAGSSGTAVAFAFFDGAVNFDGRQLGQAVVRLTPRSFPAVRPGTGKI